MQSVSFTLGFPPPPRQGVIRLLYLSFLCCDSGMCKNEHYTSLGDGTLPQALISKAGSLVSIGLASHVA